MHNYPSALQLRSERWRSPGRRACTPIARTARTFIVVARGKLCARPGCGRASTSVLTYDYDGQVVYIDAPGTYDPIGAALCDKHAARQSGPVGWVVIDRRVLGRMVAQQAVQAEAEAAAYAIAYADVFADSDDEFDDDELLNELGNDDLMPGEDDPSLFPYPAMAMPKGPDATLFSFADEVRDRQARSWVEAEAEGREQRYAVPARRSPVVMPPSVLPSEALYDQELAHDDDRHLLDDAEFFAPGFADTPNDIAIPDLDDELTLFDEDVWDEARFDAESARAADDARHLELERRLAAERLMSSPVLTPAEAPLDRWSSALDRALPPHPTHTGQRRAG